MEIKLSDSGKHREKNHRLTILPNLSTSTPNPFPSGSVPFLRRLVVFPPGPGWTTGKGPQPLIRLETCKAYHYTQWSNISSQHREILGAWSAHHHVASSAKVLTLGSLQVWTWRPGSYSYTSMAIFSLQRKVSYQVAASSICLWFYIYNLWHMQLVYPQCLAVNVLKYLFMLLPLSHLSFISLIEVYKSILLPPLKERNVYCLLCMWPPYSLFFSRQPYTVVFIVGFIYHLVLFFFMSSWI